MHRDYWHWGKAEEKKLPLISVRLKRKRFLVEELGLFFPGHLSTEVWTHEKKNQNPKNISTSLPRAGEPWQRLDLFWVRAGE